MAGTGKSTLSRTIALELAEKKRLAASFFFSRGRGDISHAGKFFTTIAAQLATSLPVLKASISNAIENNPDILQQKLREQWKHLILNPLKNAPAQSIQLVVVIDALDECDSMDDVKVILELLAEARDLDTIQLRILVTSRPETPIKIGFTKLPGGAYQDFVLHDIPLTTVNHDISVFFQQKLSLVKAENKQLRTPWPDEQTIQRLVEKSAGLFIYAATTYRFIQDKAYDPEEQLALILAESAFSSSSPTKDLDDMYIKLLQFSVIGKRGHMESELVARFKEIVGSIVVMFNVMPIDNLAKLLDQKSKIASRTLDPLHSVVNVPENKSQPVRIFHLSFRDFLLDSRRCVDSRFWIDSKETHISLFRKSMEHISKLQENICGLPELGTLVTEIPPNTIQEKIALHVQYACRYWLDHFQCGYSGDTTGATVTMDQDMQAIRQFLEQHFLHWLEGLSLIGEVSNGVLMVIALEEMLSVSYILCLN